MTHSCKINLYKLQIVRKHTDEQTSEEQSSVITAPKSALKAENKHNRFLLTSQTQRRLSEYILYDNLLNFSSDRRI